MRWVWRRFLLDHYPPALLRRRKQQLLLILTVPVSGSKSGILLRGCRFLCAGLMFLVFSAVSSFFFSLLFPQRLAPAKFFHAFIIYFIHGIAVNNQSGINHFRKTSF